MKELFFASDDTPQSNAKSSKRKANTSVVSKRHSDALGRQLVREQQKVLTQCKKALEQIQKVQQLTHEILPKLENHVVHMHGHLEGPLDASLICTNFDTILKEALDAEKKLIVFLSSCQNTAQKHSSSPQAELSALFTRQAQGRDCREGEYKAPIPEISKERQGRSIVVSDGVSDGLLFQTLKAVDESIAEATTFVTATSTAERQASAALPSLSEDAAIPYPLSQPEAAPEFPASAPARVTSVLLRSDIRSEINTAPLSSPSPADASLKSSLGILTLLHLHGIGPQWAEKLVDRFGTLAELREAPSYQLKGFVPSNVERTLRTKEKWEKAVSEAARIIDTASRFHTRLVTIWDEEYPKALAKISDRPLVLYVRGRLKPSSRAVACIGTRKPSKFGYEVTRRITSMMVQQGWDIVSGLALGVDTLAHESALESRGYTVAVLANGLDSIYPRQNAYLAERIVEAGGALISEQPFGTRLLGHHFVHRDRIQSGMSIGTIVLQTGIVGGSMHTVRYTLTQGRLLFVPVPSGTHRNEPESQGLIALTELTGPELAKKLNTSEAYTTLLQKKFTSCPPGVPLSSRENYEAMLNQLEHAYQHQGSG